MMLKKSLNRWGTLCVLVCIIGGCQVREEKVLERYDNGLPRRVGNYKGGKRDGQFTDYYENGQIASIVFYQNDLPSGTSFTFDLNGDTTGIVNLKHGKQWGVTRSFFSGNRLAQEVEFVDGQLDGRETFFYEDGHVRHRGTNSRGIRVGVWKYYDISGRLTKVESWEKGKLVEAKP